jgi:hypothetical protein
MPIGVLVFSRGKIPYSYCDLRRYREIRVCDWKTEPFVPYSRVFERLVRCLDGNGEGLALSPYLGSNVELRIMTTRGLASVIVPYIRN